MGERQTPEAPHPGKGRPPRAPSCRPHSVQSQHKKAGLPAGGRATPSKARGRRDRATPARAKKAEHGTAAGNTEGHEPPGTALPAPCTRTARSARATLTRRGGEAGTPRKHERTHRQRTQGADPKGNRTEPAECTDHMEWRTSRRREGDTRAGQPATCTARGVRAGRSPRGDARTGTGPDPSRHPRAPRTHDQGTAPAKAVVAHSATHQPHG